MNLYVAEWRVHFGYTQEQLAALAHIQGPSLSRIESKRRASPVTIQKIARALGIRNEQLRQPPPSMTQPEHTRPSKEELFEGLGAYYRDGLVKDDDILDFLALVREERKNRGLKP